MHTNSATNFINLQTLQPDLDLRNLLLISLLLGIAVFIISQPKYSLLVLAVCLAFLLMQKKFARFVRFAIISVVVSGSFFASALIENPLVKDLIGFMLIFMLKFLPLFVIASVITQDLPTSEIIGAFNKLHLPKPILLSLVVSLRYIPTIKEETAFIIQSMKSRGIGLSLKNIFTKPLRSVEYILIPLLFRSLTIAEELAATAITRGIESPNKRSCFIDIKFRRKDYLVLTYFVFSIVGIIVLDKLC